MAKEIKIDTKIAQHYSNRKTVYVLNRRGSKQTLEKEIVEQLEKQIPFLLPVADNRFGAKERLEGMGHDVTLYEGGGKYGCSITAAVIKALGVDVEITIKIKDNEEE